MRDPKLSNPELGRPGLEQYALLPTLPLALVLDNLRSGHNVGSAFRTADAFRLRRLLLCGFTPTPPHKEIRKTALGATDTVPWTSIPQTTQAVERLRAEGYTVLAFEQTQAATSLRDFRPEPGRPYAFVFGNEINGVDQEVVDLCHGCLEIPQFGTKHSLNVSVAIGMAIWHYALAAGLDQLDTPGETPKPQDP